MPNLPNYSNPPEIIMLTGMVAFAILVVMILSMRIR